MSVFVLALYALGLLAPQGNLAVNAMRARTSSAEEAIRHGQEIEPSAHSYWRQGRELLQSYGKAYGYIRGTGVPNELPEKNYALANQCYVSSSTTAQVNCTLSGTFEQVIPACCPSATGNQACATFDDGSDIQCSLSYRAYPACCPTRNQPANICKVYPAGSVIVCLGQLPSASCCSGSYCSALSQLSLTCAFGSTPGCCPA